MWLEWGGYTLDCFTTTSHAVLIITIIFEVFSQSFSLLIPPGAASAWISPTLLKMRIKLISWQKHETNWKLKISSGWDISLNMLIPQGNGQNNWQNCARQHCRNNICCYIGWIDKYCICQYLSIQPIKQQILRRPRCLNCAVSFWNVGWLWEKRRIGSGRQKKTFESFRRQCWPTRVYKLFVQIYFVWWPNILNCWIAKKEGEFWEQKSQEMWIFFQQLFSRNNPGN